MTPLAFSRGQMAREAALTEADLAEVDAVEPNRSARRCLLILLYPLQPQPILQWRQDVTRPMVIEPSELAPFLPTRAASFLH
jgi:hypothetical protein